MKLTIKNLTVKINEKNIIKDINLKIENHELVMILGLNGAGKTTLLKAMVGLTKNIEGSILYNGINLNKMSFVKRAKLISYIPQSIEKLPHYSVRDFVLLGTNPSLDFFQIPDKSYDKTILKVLNKFNISHLKNSYMDCISGGERQLVYLARATMQNTDLMILDEPTSSLDYKNQHEFLEILKKYIYESDRGAILSIHDPNLALKYADKIIVIHNNTVYKRIKRTNENFEINLFEALNEVYNYNLNLIESGNSYLFNWKGE